MKPGTIIKAISTNSFFETTKGREAVVLEKPKFSNGEHHVKGSWVDNDVIFELPTVLFEEPITNTGLKMNDMSEIIVGYVLAAYTYDKEATVEALKKHKFESKPSRGKYATLISYLEELVAGEKFDLASSRSTTEWVAIYKILSNR